MTKVSLTPTMVKNFVCPEGKPRIDLHDSQCKGLSLEVRVSGGKTYYFRYRSNRGKPRQVKLADAQDITLTQARTLADKARADIVMGIDPKEQKDSIKAVMTFKDFAIDHYMSTSMEY